MIIYHFMNLPNPTSDILVFISLNLNAALIFRSSLAIFASAIMRIGKIKTIYNPATRITMSNVLNMFAVTDRSVPDEIAVDIATWIKWR